LVSASTEAVIWLGMASLTKCRTIAP
jgi:hypothetical protein